MTRYLLPLLLVACTSSAPGRYRDGARLPPPEPTTTYAPAGAGLSEYFVPPEPKYPRSPHTRVLPPTKGPGLWSGDAPRASHSNPQGAPEITKAAPQREALRATDEAEAKDEEFVRVEASAEASGEPPNCDGQNHHVISRPIAKALEDHRTLRGLYEPRDERFVAKAKDKESHCGYQEWHRKVDAEVVSWLERNRNATAEQFMSKLREIYNRKEMRERFPNGFGPSK